MKTNIHQQQQRRRSPPPRTSLCWVQVTCSQISNGRTAVRITMEFDIYINYMTLTSRGRRRCTHSRLWKHRWTNAPQRSHRSYKAKTPAYIHLKKNLKKNPHRRSQQPIETIIWIIWLEIHSINYNKAHIKLEEITRSCNRKIFVFLVAAFSVNQLLFGYSSVCWWAFFFLRRHWILWPSFIVYRDNCNRFVLRLHYRLQKNCLSSSLTVSSHSEEIPSGVCCVGSILWWQAVNLYIF